MSRQASEPSPDPVNRADGEVALEVLEALPDPLLVCNSALRVRLLNAGARELLGLGPILSAGIGLGDLLAGSRRFSPVAVRHLQRAAAAGIGGRKRPEFGFSSAPGLRFRMSLSESGLLLIRPRPAAAERRGVRPRIDALTGLPDRRAFLGRLGAALSEHHAGAGFAVLTFDLCGFRAVNDALGHRAGDRLLRSCAARLRDGVRAGDVVARIGADEFAVLQAGAVDPQRVEILARRLLERLAEPSVAGGQMVTLCARAGYAMAPEDGDEAALLLRRAGLALAESKTEGCAGPCRFDPGMEARVQARHDMISGLQDALARREFLLHYQPQINLATGGLTGSRRCYAGSIRCAACCRPAPSSPSRRSAG
jgi:diguanylate cyclase (GGDEF)-like protein